MALVPAKCTQCGAELTVDNSKDAYVCDFCHTPFIIEKAINHYNSYNSNIYNIQNANLNIDDNSVEKRLDNANVYLNKLNMPNKAYDLYLSITADAPGDYRGWWGLLLIITQNFSNISDGINSKSIYYYKNAVAVADDNHKKELEAIWSEFTEKCQKYEEDLERKRNIQIENERYEQRFNVLSKTLKYYIRKRRTAITWLIIATLLIILSFFFRSDEETTSIAITLLLLPGIFLSIAHGVILLISLLKIKKYNNEIYHLTKNK